MHPLFAKADALSREAIGAAIEVHRDKGPGLLESIYERCLLHELSLRKHAAINQKLVRATYKDLTFGRTATIRRFGGGLSADRSKIS